MALSDKEWAVEQLIRDVKNSRPDEARDFLFEHIANHGTEGFDAQAVAQHIEYRQENGE